MTKFGTTVYVASLSAKPRKTSCIFSWEKSKKIYAPNIPTLYISQEFQEGTLVRTFVLASFDLPSVWSILRRFQTGSLRVFSHGCIYRRYNLLQMFRIPVSAYTLSRSDERSATKSTSAGAIRDIPATLNRFFIFLGGKAATGDDESSKTNENESERPVRRSN